jgi:hypothetical protein
MTPNIELAKPRDFGEIISDTFTFIRQNLKPLLKYFFIFSGFFILASTATSVMIQVRAIGVFNNLNPDDSPNGTIFANVSYIMVNTLFAMVFILLEYLSITVTVLCYMALYKQKQNTVPTVEEMWGYFKFYFFKVLGSSIVIYFIIVIGAVFCIIPGVYLYAVMALVLPIMVIENTSFGYAFNQSFRLIKDNWWVTFGVLVVIFIIIYVASIFVSMPAAVVDAGNLFLHLTKGTQVTLPIAILSTLLQEICHVFHIITVVGAVLCYFNLTESKEGTGLIERMNQFGTTKPDTNITPEEY